MKWLQDILKDVEGGESLYKQITAGIGQEFVSKADFNVANEEKKRYLAQLEERDKDIQDLKAKAGNNEELQNEFNELQAQYQQAKEDQAKAISSIKKENALDLAIMQSKGRNTKAIKAMLDLDSISLKDDGTLEGLDLSKLQESDPYLFEIETKSIEGTGYTPGVPNKTVDFSKMNYTQMAEYMVNNPDANI